MVYTIKKNKNLIISSSIFAGINCNNIYCGCSGDTQKNTTPNNGKKNNNKPSSDENNNNPNGDENKDTSQDDDNNNEEEDNNDKIPKDEIVYNREISYWIKNLNTFIRFKYAFCNEDNKKKLEELFNNINKITNKESLDEFINKLNNITISGKIPLLTEKDIENNNNLGRIVPSYCIHFFAAMLNDGKIDINNSVDIISKNFLEGNVCIKAGLGNIFNGDEISYSNSDNYYYYYHKEKPELSDNYICLYEKTFSEIKDMLSNNYNSYNKYIFFNNEYIKNKIKIYQEQLVFNLTNCYLKNGEKNVLFKFYSNISLSNDNFFHKVNLLYNNLNNINCRVDKDTLTNFLKENFRCFKINLPVSDLPFEIFIYKYYEYDAIVFNGYKMVFADNDPEEGTYENFYKSIEKYDTKNGEKKYIYYIKEKEA